MGGVKNSLTPLRQRSASAMHTFNAMDAGWLKDTLATTVTYGSQSVLETLHGKGAVWDYLSGKTYSHRSNPKRRPRCELGVSEIGKPSCTNRKMHMIAPGLIYLW
jgi:hypothetical protein